MRGADRQTGKLFSYASPESLVPQDHPLRAIRLLVNAALDRLSPGFATIYADAGRPSIPPEKLLRALLLQALFTIRSERQLMSVVADRLSLRWYLGYDLAESLPDHSSLTRIRQRLGLPVFRRFFEHVVELCDQAGLVWGKELFFDGTKVRANADFDSLTPRFAQAAREHVTELFGQDAAADTEHSAEPPSGAGVALPTALPGDAEPPAAGAAHDGTALPLHQPDDGDAVPSAPSFSGDAATDQRLAAENQARWQLLEERRLDPQRPPSGSGGYRRITDFRVSTTDPDAAPLNKSESGKLG